MHGNWKLKSQEYAGSGILNVLFTSGFHSETLKL